MKNPIQVFSDWAISGKDEGMKDNHFMPVMKMIELFENKYENPSIIDAGCGNGWLIRHFYENKKYTNLTGVDGSREMIAKAKTLDHKNNYICSELDLWKPDNKVDVVISMEVIYYFKNPEIIIKHIFNNWIKKNGVFIMRIDFYQENDTSVQILAKMEGALTDSSEIVDVEVEKTALGAGWQTLTFDFASERRNSYPFGAGHPQEQGLSALDSYQKLVIFRVLI